MSEEGADWDEFSFSLIGWVGVVGSRFPVTLFLFPLLLE